MPASAATDLTSGWHAEVDQLVEQWSEEPCVASSILALGTVRLFAGLFVSRVFDRAAQARRKQMVRALRYTMFGEVDAELLAPARAPSTSHPKPHRSNRTRT